ncbi:MAG: hypothetical protein RLZZ234_516 [Candidatus Parcubacteria bacterium]
MKWRLILFRHKVEIETLLLGSVGLGERLAVDEVGFIAHILAVGIAGIRDQAVLVAGLRRAPRSHDLDRFPERVLDRAAVTLGLVGAFRIGGLVPAEELLLADDVLLAGRVRHDPVVRLGGVGRFLRAAGELGDDLLTFDSRSRLHASLLLEDGSLDQCGHDFG